MDRKLILLAVAAAVLLSGAAVYVFATSEAGPTGACRISSPEAVQLACGKSACDKKAESDKSGEKKACPKSGGCEKQKGLSQERQLPEKR